MCYVENSAAAQKGKLGEDFVIVAFKKTYPKNFKIHPFAAKNGASLWDFMFINKKDKKMLAEVKTLETKIYSGEPYFLVNPDDYQKYLNDFNYKLKNRIADGAQFVFVSGELKRTFVIAVARLMDYLNEQDANSAGLKRLPISILKEGGEIPDDLAAQIVAIKPNETVKEDDSPQEDNVVQTETFLPFQLSDDPPSRFAGGLFPDEEPQEVNNLPSDKVTPLEGRVIFDINGAEVNMIMDFAQELKIEFSIDDWSKCVKYAVNKYKQKHNIGGEVFIQTLTPIEDFLLKSEHYV